MLTQPKSKIGLNEKNMCLSGTAAGITCQCQKYCNQATTYITFKDVNGGMLKTGWPSALDRASSQGFTSLFQYHDRQTAMSIPMIRETNATNYPHLKDLKFSCDGSAGF
jgi:hypothetical protein